MTSTRRKQSTTIPKPLAKPAVVGVASGSHSARVSGSRELQDMLAARLNETAIEQSMLTPLARTAIVIALATAAWAPIVGTAYYLS